MASRDSAHLPGLVAGTDAPLSVAASVECEIIRLRLGYLGRCVNISRAVVVFVLHAVSRASELKSLKLTHDIAPLQSIDIGRPSA